MLGLGIRKAVKAQLSRLLNGEEAVTETRAYAAPAPVPAAAAKPVAAKPVAEAKPVVEAKPVAEARPAARADGPVAQPVVLPPAKAVAMPKAVPVPSPVVEAALAEPPADDVVGRPFTPDAVQAVLDDMVRPALQADGGDISLVRLEDHSVYVRLVGSCSSCPSSIATMKLGVERLLMEEFPEMRALVQVD